MLFKLSLANIKKSFKDYTIYFFTLIIGIAIFYIFNRSTNCIFKCITKHKTNNKFNE